MALERELLATWELLAGLKTVELRMPPRRRLVLVMIILGGRRCLARG